MKNKRYLGFLIITLVLVVAMFSNVFAITGSGWTCISSYNTSYSVGSIINSVCSDFNIKSGYDSASCVLKSNFDVKAGDEVFISFGTSFYGDESKYDGSASICGAHIKTEDGTVLASVSYELNGYHISGYGNDSITITDETAGKLVFVIGLEGSGTFGVGSLIDELFVEVNGYEM